MSIQRQQADPRTFDSEQFPRSRSLTTALLHRIFSGLESGNLVIDTPAGERLVIDGNQPGPQRRLTICSWRFLWRLVAGWDIGFAESYGWRMVFAESWRAADARVVQFGVRGAAAAAASAATLAQASARLESEYKAGEPAQYCRPL
jgi:hypothetical protein